MLQGIARKGRVAAGRQPFQPDGEQEHQQRPQDEDRHGEQQRGAAEQGGRSNHPPGLRAAFSPAGMPTTSAISVPAAISSSCGQPERDLGSDRMVVDQREPQVAARQIAEIGEILLPDRPVEAEPLAEFRDRGRIGVIPPVVAAIRPGRPARDGASRKRWSPPPSPEARHWRRGPRRRASGDGRLGEKGPDEVESAPGMWMNRSALVHAVALRPPGEGRRAAPPRARRAACPYRLPPASSRRIRSGPGAGARSCARGNAEGAAVRRRK